MKTKPNVLNVGGGYTRVDLRPKRFESVRNLVSGGKRCLDFKIKAEAERKAVEIENLLLDYGRQRTKSLEIGLKVDLASLQQRLTPFNKTLEDAVLFYEKHLTKEQHAQNSNTMEVLLNEWLELAKTRMNEGSVSQRRYKTLYYKIRGSNGYIAKWGSRPVGTITREEITEWLDSQQNLAARTRFHSLAGLRQFFLWCKRDKKAITENPADGLLVEVANREPVCFTAEEATRIMSHAQNKEYLALLPFHAICLFAGVRPDECSRLTWDAVDFDDGSIVIRHHQSKTKGRRVSIQPNLLTWLQWFQVQCPTYSLIPPTNLEYKLRRFRQSIGIEWKDNGMRHSYASFILGSKLGDYSYLEGNMGNSRKMLMNHYLSFPTKSESDKFWSIIP